MGALLQKQPYSLLCEYQAGKGMGTAVQGRYHTDACLPGLAWMGQDIHGNQVDFRKVG